MGMQSSKTAKIETIIHEGSHHHLMSTDDEQYGGKDMYGRRICLEVAAQCQSCSTRVTRQCLDACNKARRNADNFCYFVNEAGQGADDGTQTGGNGGSPPTNVPNQNTGGGGDNTGTGGGDTEEEGFVDKLMG